MKKKEQALPKPEKLAPFKCGEIYSYDGIDYIYAQTGPGVYRLLQLCDGNRWSDEDFPERKLFTHKPDATYTTEKED